MTRDKSQVPTDSNLGVESVPATDGSTGSEKQLSPASLQMPILSEILPTRPGSSERNTMSPESWDHQAALDDLLIYQQTTPHWPQVVWQSQKSHNEPQWFND